MLRMFRSEFRLTYGCTYTSPRNCQPLPSGPDVSVVPVSAYQITVQLCYVGVEHKHSRVYKLY